MPLDAPLTLAALNAQVDALQGDTLLRLKGVIRLDDGALRDVQWSVGDRDIAPFAGDVPRLGLTCIWALENPALTTKPTPFVF